MGALHDGHLSLMRRAKADNELVAASLFVNPTQFAPTDDLDAYPRTWEADLAQLARASVDFVFAPRVDEMYPPHRPALLAPYVDLAGVDATTAEGSARPGFFRGVSTVVAKLLNITQPKAVYFGQKDGMQCIVVRRLIEDLNFNVRMVVCPTARESDGLAMSSRNVYLSAEERAAAPAVYASLLAVRSAYAKGGVRSVDALRAAAANVVSAQRELSPGVDLEMGYLSLASALSGQEYPEGGQVAPSAAEPTLASIAVKVGSTRLIDNVVLE